MEDIEQLIWRLDQARTRIEAILPQVDPQKQIYPGWTIHQFLAHMTSWDDAVIAALQAHLGNTESGTPAARGIDQFNTHTIETRETLDLEKIKQEWQETRNILKDILRAMPEEKFHQPILFPWGGYGSVAQLIETFIHHELEEHLPELETWVKHPDQPLAGRHA